jgi:tripartite-type tricarboxylate transporter receptor subunit TctC
MSGFTRTTRRGLLGGALALASAPAVAQPAFPERPIRYVVPFGTGGATDIVARSFSQRLTELLGWTIAVENRPGAGGNLGAEQAARAAADGHTWLLGTVGIVATNPLLYRDMPFDPQRDLRAVGLLGALPNLLVVGPSVPARTLAEFLAVARSRPAGLTFSSSGNGTTSHLSGELLRLMSGVNLVHVPYRSAGQAHTDIIAGRVDFTVDNLPAVIGFARGGQMTPLAVTSAARDPALPEVPTIAEAGLPGYEATSWFALMLPAGVPAPVATRIEAAMRRVLADEALVSAWRMRGISVGDRFGTAFENFAEAERIRWRDVITRGGITLG